MVNPISNLGAPLDHIDLFSPQSPLQRVHLSQKACTIPLGRLGGWGIGEIVARRIYCSGFRDGSGWVLASRNGFLGDLARREQVIRRATPKTENQLGVLRGDARPTPKGHCLEESLGEADPDAGAVQVVRVVDRISAGGDHPGGSAEDVEEYSGVVVAGECVPAGRVC